MKYLKLFENFEQEDIIEEFDPRTGIKYVIDTKKKPKPGDEVLDTDGNYLIYKDEYDLDILGVIINKIEENPEQDQQDQQDKKVLFYNKPSTNPNLIKIPKTEEVKLICTNDFEWLNNGNRFNFKKGDILILNNYNLSDDEHYYIMKNINDKEVGCSGISIEKLTDNFRLFENITQNINEISKERGTDKRTEKLGTLYFNQFIGLPLFDGKISNIISQISKTGNYRIVQVEIDYTRFNPLGRKDKDYIDYDIDTDYWNLGTIGHTENVEIDRKDSVLLSKIALHINQDSKYRETGKYFNIKGMR